MRTVRQQIESAGERLWRLDDFTGLPFTAVAQALSRRTKQGVIERLSKGVYFRGRATAFGQSKPNPAAIQKLASRRSSVFPSGTSAANLLGFSTQTARQGEVSTSALSLPRKLVGSDTLIHTRRPSAWIGLSQDDAALLDFLRRKGLTSELSPADTARRLLMLLSKDGRYQRLLKIAATEPPRVRAILGAAGKEIGIDDERLRRIRQSLNPLSRFDFGTLAALKHAREWQAKERR
jgi:hypothetical protein